MTTETQSETTVAEHLEYALDDLNEARRHAEEEFRSRIDSAITRAREALDGVRSGVEGRAEHLRESVEERAADWQRTLEDASEDARRELGMRSVRAQRTPDALDELADEIKKQRHQLVS